MLLFYPSPTFFQWQNSPAKPTINPRLPFVKLIIEIHLRRNLPYDIRYTNDEIQPVRYPLNTNDYRLMTKLWLRGKIFFEMVINEIFYSLQGEGLLAGVPGVFIRLAGCSLRCRWCDTKYALDPSAGEDLSISAIIDKVEQWRCRFAVITGGEPMINPQLPKLTAELKKHGKHITIETAGIAFIEGLACDLMSISPKLSNSGQTRLRLRASPRRETENQAVKQLISNYPYQLKFVVDSPDDLPEIQRTIQQLGKVESGRIMLMPQAKTRDELITKAPMVAELCKQTGWTFCNRLQILLYDGVRGK